MDGNHVADAHGSCVEEVSQNNMKIPERKRLSSLNS